MSNPFQSAHEWIQQGAQLLAEHRLREALYCIEQALHLEPSNPVAHNYHHLIRAQLESQQAAIIPPGTLPQNGEDFSAMLGGFMPAVGEFSIAAEDDPGSSFEELEQISEIEMRAEMEGDWDADELELPMEQELASNHGDSAWNDEALVPPPMPESDSQVMLEFEPPELTPSFSPSEMELPMTSSHHSGDELELPTGSRIEMDEVPSQALITAFSSAEVDQAFDINFEPPSLMAADDPDFVVMEDEPQNQQHSMQENTGAGKRESSSMIERQNINEMFQEISARSAPLQEPPLSPPEGAPVIFPQQSIGFQDAQVDNTLEEIPRISSNKTPPTAPPVRREPPAPAHHVVAEPVVQEHKSSGPKVNIDAMLTAAEELMEVGAVEDAQELMDAVEAIRPGHPRLMRLQSLKTSHARKSLEQKYSSMSLKPKLLKPLAELQHMQLNNHEGFVLSQIDGRTTLDNIMLICGLDKNSLLQMIDNFERLGIVKI